MEKTDVEINIFLVSLVSNFSPCDAALTWAQSIDLSSFKTRPGHPMPVQTAAAIGLSGFNHGGKARVYFFTEAGEIIQRSS